MRRLALLAGFAMFVLSSSAQSLKEAIRLSSNEKFEEAARMFNQLIIKSPKKGDNYYYAGLNYLEAGDSLKALDMFNKGKAAEPKNFINHLGLAALALRSQKFDEAKVLINAADAGTKKKLKPFLYQEIGHVYIINNNLPAAVKKQYAAEALIWAEKSDNLKPAQGYNYLYLGQAYQMADPIKNAEKASIKFAQAWDASRIPMALYKDAEFTLFAAKNPEGAIERLNELKAAEKDFPPTYRLLGDCYSELGKENKANFDTAVMFYELYSQKNKEPSAKYVYVKSLFKASQFEKCIAESKSLLTIRDFPYLNGLIAFSYNKLPGKTQTQCTEALDYLAKYETYLLGNNRKMSAGEYYTKAGLMDCAKKPGFEENYVLALADTANCTVKMYDDRIDNFYKRQNWSNLLRVLDAKAIKTTPSSYDYWFRGFAQNKLKNYDAADMAYAKSYAMDSSSARCLKARAKNAADKDTSWSNSNTELAYNNYVNRLKKDMNNAKNDSVRRAIKSDIGYYYGVMGQSLENTGYNLYNSKDYIGTVDYLEKSSKYFEMAKLFYTSKDDLDEINKHITNNAKFATQLSKYVKQQKDKEAKDKKALEDKAAGKK